MNPILKKQASQEEEEEEEEEEEVQASDRSTIQYQFD
jgi:CO dehydrogenase/acetyl-CoA synthase beta subunit